MLRSASSLRRLKYHYHYPKSLSSSLVTTSHLRYSSSKSSKHSDEDNVEPELPLKGIRVLELGQLIAGPFAGQLLGQFGAEIIKIEPPTGGDPLRTWREVDEDGTGPWFRSLGRNKKSVGVDLRDERGRGVVRGLMRGEGKGKVDVVLENFKPGTLEKWGLGPADIHPYNPDLIYTRVSGYGQTGPWAHRPGYASVCEAESGFRYINGYPDEQGNLVGAPVRPNISLGDSVAGLHAAFGTVLALLARQRQNQGNRVREGKDFAGRIVDVSIVESMLNLMEGIIPEYDRKGKIRGPSGSSVTGIVPTNAYPCLPSPSSTPSAPSTPSSGPPKYSYIVIGANGDSIYTRLMHAISRPDLTSPLYSSNTLRVERQAEIEQAISEWTKERTVDEVVAKMNEAGVPVGRVVSVREVVREEWVVGRGSVREVPVRPPGRSRGAQTRSLDHGKAEGNEEPEEDNEEQDQGGYTLKMQSTFPVLSGVDGQPRWAGPDLGEHTTEVLRDVAGMSEGEIEDLRRGEVVR